MRKRLMSALALLSLLLPAASMAKEKLSSAQREWLENVSPIITKTERDVFLKLMTDEERNKFIQFFWRQRDPLPDTAENEFYKEYMGRVRFADQYFGIGSSKRASQTDRGFYYLLLGKPLERQIFATQSEIWPLELWFYKGEEEYGLPPYFYLIFYQPQGIGEYRLYSPGFEGPETLVIPSMSTQSINRSNAVGIIKKINAELSRASLSYLPSDGSSGMESFSSDNIIAAARNLPEKKYSDSYARSFLSFKDYVETEYSHSYLNAGSKLKLFYTAGQPFIHWSIEPDKMSFAQRGDFYFAGFELIIRMEDLKGNLVLEKTEEIPVRLTPEQYKTHERQRFAFQDLLPVIPGEYNFFFMLKNKTSKDFTSFDRRISVPGEKTGPCFSHLVLFHGQENVPEIQRKNLKAFTFDGIQYIVSARNEFLLQESIGAYIQAGWPEGTAPDADAWVALDIITADGDTLVRNQKIPLAEIQPHLDGGIVFGPLALASFKPGYYRVEASLFNGGRKILSEGENFILLTQPYPVLPWAYAKVHESFPAADQLSLLGSQYFMTGKFEKARDFFNRALKMKDDAPARLMLSKCLYALNRFQESLALASPLYELTKDREAAKVIALDLIGLRDWAAALVYLDQLMAKATEISVLNLAAECHINLGQQERALPLIQKSLSLNPTQPAIKAMEEKAKKALEKK